MLAADWRRVLVDDPMNARPIVSSLLKGRVMFTPIEPAVLPASRVAEAGWAQSIGTRASSYARGILGDASSARDFSSNGVCFGAQILGASAAVRKVPHPWATHDVRHCRRGGRHLGKLDAGGAVSLHRSSPIGSPATDLPRRRQLHPT